jgi:all-trans-8'-apo-beta-carotenal 15,15'-oxygenase
MSTDSIVTEPKLNANPVAPVATSRDATSTPSSLTWMSSLRDLSSEHGFEPLRVEGALPTELSGTLYRTGPSLFSSFGKPYGHLFDGDGAVSAVRFANGRALGAVKLVQTEGLVKERRAGRQLYGAGYGTMAPGLNRFWPPAVRSRLKNPANTAILLWGERVFALYEGGLPTEIAPSDLATLGEQDLGIVVENFSAHPHAVPSRRAIYNFGLRYGRKTILDIYELNDSGGGRKLAEVPLAQTTLIHDFVATEKHLVFFAPPVRFNTLSLLFGLDTLDGAMRWRPELGTDVIVVPIDDPERVVRFTVDAFFQWHHLNAYERGNEIVVDVVRYPDFGSNHWFGALIEPHPMRCVAGELWRITLDPGARRGKSEPRWSHPCEFPRVAPGVETKRHTIGWLAAYATSTGNFMDRLPNAVAKVEVETGRESVWQGGSGVVSEPIFVPRPGNGAEDDGWVLALVYDPASDTSNVTVLDARDLSAGPLARAWFDHHVPPTFHGAFAKPIHARNPITGPETLNLFAEDFRRAGLV